MDIIIGAITNVNIVLATALPSGIPHDNILARQTIVLGFCKTFNVTALVVTLYTEMKFEV